MDVFFEQFRLYAMVALGIGLVIFVHELGHFLAARWCGVRVEVFSLGFGPRIFGWRRGGTMYQLSAVPLGGYVKMAGEEAQERGGEPASDELPAKSVGQRFLIYSGGVIMNMVFALVVFPMILMAGVRFPEPVVDVVPGGPAWKAGIEPGTRVVSVNGNEVVAFHHIVSEVALGSPQGTQMVVVPPGSTTPTTIHLQPEYDEEMGAFVIGVGPDPDPLSRVEVSAGSPAAAAGLHDGDQVVSVEGGLAGLPIYDQLAVSMQKGDPVTATIRRPGGQESVVTIQPRPTEKPAARLGLEPIFGRVAELRSTPLVAATGLRKDDRILAVNDAPVLRSYDLVRRLAQVESAPEEAARKLHLQVERNGSRITLDGPVLKPGDAVRLHKDVAVLRAADTAIVAVTPGSAAEAAGIQSGDRIARVGQQEVGGFRDILDAVKGVKAGETLQLAVERDTGERRTSFAASVALEPLAQPEYGLNIRQATYIYKASNPLEAVQVGMASSWKLVKDSWLTLKRILLGSVSGSNIGGIITIGVVSHSWASDGIAKLLFFLCMLSVNLAFLNVLPIPVLDGGHLFFLLIEKIKGSPVSERVLGYSQLVGIVLIVSLMVYVTYNDVVRWFLK